MISENSIATGSINYDITETVTRSVKTEWVIVENKRCRIRRCPACGHILIYKSKRGYFNCKKRNSLCGRCATKKRINEHGNPLPYKGGIKLTDDHKRKLSVAGVYRHKKYKHPMKGRSHTKECIERVKLKMTGKGNPMYGKRHTEETRKKISETRKLKKIPGPTMSVDGLKRLRQKRIKEIEIDRYNGNQIIPSFNKKSCLFFDLLEKELGWNGHYATKNREYHIKELGYFLDYYEPTKNIVVEWDERRHYNVDGTLKEKDRVRQKQIEDFLRCKVLRIDERYFDESGSLQELKIYG